MENSAAMRAMVLGGGSSTKTRTMIWDIPRKNHVDIPHPVAGVGAASRSCGRGGRAGQRVQYVVGGSRARVPKCPHERGNSEDTDKPCFLSASAMLPVVVRPATVCTLAV